MGKKAEIVRADGAQPVDAEQLRTRTLELVTVMGSNLYELGQNLYEINTGELWKGWDYGSFVEYCEAELSYESRKAYHLIEIWEKFAHKLGYTWEDVQHIQWSKLARIAPIVEGRRDANKWLKSAEDHSRRELETLIKQHKNESGAGADNKPDEKPAFTRIHHDTEKETEETDAPATTAGPFVDITQINPDVFMHSEVDVGKKQPLHEFKTYLYPEQWSEVMAAMQRAGQVGRTKKACAQLELIAMEYNTQFASTEDGGAAHALARYVKTLERVFDCKITVEVGRDSKLRYMSRVSDKAPEDEGEPEEAGKGRKGKKTSGELQW